MTTNTYPMQIYPIKVKGMWIEAVRTRETWNNPSTGKFIAFDMAVENVIFRVMCENPDCINSVSNGASVYWFEQSLGIHRFTCDACDQKMKVVDFNENPDE